MTAPSPFGLALTLAVLKCLTDEIGRVRREQAGAEAIEAWPVGTRLPVYLGGHVVATVSRPSPPTLVNVTDPAKLLAWAQEANPEQVEMVPTLRESFVRSLREAVRKDGGLLDKNTGDVTPVPGMERETGKEQVKVELADVAAEVIGSAWRAGQIDLPAMLALPAGGETDAA